jgi:hypothetical protein
MSFRSPPDNPPKMLKQKALQLTEQAVVLAQSKVGWF